MSLFVVGNETLRRRKKERKKGRRKERQLTLLFVSKVQSFRRKLIVWKTWIYHNELDGFTICLKTFLVESVEILGNVILKLLFIKICECFGGLCNSVSEPVSFQMSEWPMLQSCVPQRPRKGPEALKSGDSTVNWCLGFRFYLALALWEMVTCQFLI